MVKLLIFILAAAYLSYVVTMLGSFGTSGHYLVVTLLALLGGWKLADLAADRLSRSRNNAEVYVDVVCVGLIKKGQVIDWSPEGQPERAEWISESTFAEIVRASAKARVPFLPDLDTYEQARFGPSECTEILARWVHLEAAMRGRHSDPLAAVRSLLEACAEDRQNMELLVEGP